MDFNLTKEQELLRDGLARFLSTRYGLEKSRAAAKTGAGWQPGIWRGFADELGILGAAVPEDVGGIGGGPVEVMVIAEALGHALVVEPYVDTVVVAGGLLRRAGGEVAGSVLQKIVAGTAIVALAAAEPTSGDDWQDVSTTAQPDGDDWILHGSKIVAMSVPLATHMLISARTADGISLFLVDVDSAGPGLEVHSYRTIDDRRAADLVIDGLRLPARALLGGEGQAWPSGSRSVASRCCSIAWLICTWNSSRPLPRYISRSCTWNPNRLLVRGRFRPRRRPSGGPPDSLDKTRCNCTAGWE